MRLIALIGSHSTGKTTLAQDLQAQLGSNCEVYHDYYRDIAIRLGYSKPREAILEDPEKTPEAVSCIASAAAAAQLQWIDSQKSDNAIIDTGIPSLMAYHSYWMDQLQFTPPNLLNRLAKLCAERVELYVYCPVGQIGLEDDGIRNNDPDFQLAIDKFVKRVWIAIQYLGFKHA